MKTGQSLGVRKEEKKIDKKLLKIIWLLRMRNQKLHPDDNSYDEVKFLDAVNKFHEKLNFKK